MNILVPHSWLTEFVHTKARPQTIADAMSLHSASVERVLRQNNDYIYEVEITTNRIDMASIEGFAREVSVVLNNLGHKAEFKRLQVKAPKKPKEVLPITIVNNPRLCKRVIGVVIDNVEQKQSPKWLKDRLEKSGVRSLNSIVDITNYVMLETGHPTHVFDYDRIKTNNLTIRTSKEGETITTFEGKHYILSGGDIVIDDGTGTIIDLPGIAGTKNSVVTPKTKRILFFIESNDPIRIRQTSMRLAIHTYASNINKNRPDPEQAMVAMKRGIELYELLTGGTVASDLIDHYSKKPKQKSVQVSQAKIDQFLGVRLPKKAILTILKKLGFITTYDIKTNSYTTIVPSWRALDVSIPEDIIEEIARIFGYHNIKSKVQIGKPITKRQDNSLYWISQIKHTLKNWGYTELLSSSLLSKDVIEMAHIPIRDAIALKNPLSEDTAYLRPSLLPTLLSALQDNQNKTTRDLKFFELSRTYKQAKKEELPNEELMLSIGCLGPDSDYTYRKTKGIVEALFEELNISKTSFAPAKTYDRLPKVLNHSTSAVIRIDNKPVGYIGMKDAYTIVDIKAQYILENATTLRKYQCIPEHPPIFEDITITLGKKVYIGTVIESIYQTSPLITNVSLVSSYKQNTTFSITFQHNKRNLTEKEIGNLKKNIVQAVKKTK